LISGASARFRRSTAWRCGEAKRDLRLGHQKRASNCTEDHLSQLSVLRGSSDSDLQVVNDDQTVWQRLIRHGTQEAVQGVLDLLDGGRPNSQPNYAGVTPRGVHSSIGEVLVKGDDDSTVFARPLYNDLVGRPLNSTSRTCRTSQAGRLERR
jgi:hypothetical protein